MSGDLLYQRELARRYQREKQQGLGNPIISTEFHGQQCVAVGPRLFYSPRWKTFYDFLWDYLLQTFGPDWFKAEALKPEPEQHPVFQLHQRVFAQLKARQVGGGQLSTAQATGAIEAYFRLAYHVYLVSHNGGLPAPLMARLKQRDQFRGADHELYVAATFTLAGFTIEFENEADNTRSHCEYTVTHRKSGKNYSVEAKARSGAPSALVRNLLGDALSKQADHDRLVWIAINAPAETPEAGRAVLTQTLAELRSREDKPLPDGSMPQSACVVVSNNPYSFSLDTTAFSPSAFAEGFRIPDLKFDQKFYSVREMRLNRDKYRPIHDLIHSMQTHHRIPTTFDGEDPAFSFGKGQGRLLIGNTYQVPDPNGSTATGRLDQALVIVEQKSVFATYHTADGHQFHVTHPLSDEEMGAYMRIPQTFFGVIDRNAMSRAQDPLELFDWMFETYRKTSKEKLLELMGGPNGQLQTMSQEELATLYCERIVDMHYQQRAANAGAQTPGGNDNG